MTTRKITLLLVAAAVAWGTVFAARQLTQPLPAAPAAQQAVASVEVAAAARDLPTGAILKESDLKWIPWAATDNGALYVKGKANLSDLAGAVVRDGFRSGEPLLSGRVVQARDAGFLAAVLRPGMRAMSVSLSPTEEVAGFIFPGDHVDVILTHSFSRKDVSNLTERRVSETVLRDVRVLALDQRSDNQSNDPKVAQLATLEVSDKQAEKLALAADMASPQGINKGSLSLVLRRIAINEKDGAASIPGIDAAALAPPASASATWDSDISPAYPSVNGEDGLMQRVQVMRGKNVTETIFERRR